MMRAVPENYSELSQEERGAYFSSTTPEYRASGRNGKRPKMANSPDLPTYSDESLALHFAERHEHELRYVAQWGRWLSCNPKWVTVSWATWRYPW